MLLDKVVIGSTSESAYYALMNECYFVPNRQIAPIFYKESLYTWPKLNAMLGLLSRRVAFEDRGAIRVLGNQIRVSAQNTTYKYDFSECFIFDPVGVKFENEVREPSSKTFIVYDDFELSTLGPKRHHINPITGGKGFAKELHFYCSGRVDGSSYITDCVVESELTQKQLYDFEYSDSMARFAVERHLKREGIYGRFMKHYTNGNPKYRSPKVLHRRRVVSERDNNLYRDTECVKFINLSLEEIVEKSTKR